jgi:hypothetical protein
MKVLYGKLQDKQFNEKNELIARLTIDKNFVGSRLDFPVIQSIGAGVGSGSIPTASENKTGLAAVSSKKLYATVNVDRETVKAAQTDLGSYVRMTVHPVKVAMRAFERNLERMLLIGDATGTGALITGSASNSNVTGAGSAGDPYIVTFNASATYNKVHATPIEEGDILNVNTETTQLVVDAMTVTNTSVILNLVGTSARLATLAGANPFTSTDKLYMQNSKDAEMIGIRGVIAASSSTLYGITVGRRWQAFQKDAASVSLSVDMINEVCLGIKQQCGEFPNLIIASYQQYLKLMNLLEDKKTIEFPAKRANVGLKSIVIDTLAGEIPLIISRFIQPTEIFFLNTDEMKLHLRPAGFEWHDEDGTVFLRTTGDAMEARYGCYGNLFVNPHFQGYLHTLAT